MSAGDPLMVKVARGVQLVVHTPGPDRKNVDVQLWLGKWPHGNQLAFLAATADDMRVYFDGTAIWFGHTKVVLPWLDLLKVADFLRLPIPVPPTEVVADAERRDPAAALDPRMELPQ